MGESSLILWLFLFTLAAAIVIGIWQYGKVQKAKKTHSHSAVTDKRPELRDGGPPPARRS